MTVIKHKDNFMHYLHHESKKSYDLLQWNKDKHKSDINFSDVPNAKLKVNMLSEPTPSRC